MAAVIWLHALGSYKLLREPQGSECKACVHMWGGASGEGSSPLWHDLLL